MAQNVGRRPDDDRPHYLGVGCFTLLVGVVGGAWIAVLVAKIVGALTGCAPVNEDGAPCNWLVYAVAGAILGGIGLPTVALLRLRSGRLEAENSERG